MYEKYDPEHVSGRLPAGLEIRVAAKNDLMGIAKLSAERNKTGIEPARQWVSREFANSEAGGGSKMFVAAVEAGIVGFARCVYIDTSIKPVKFPSPSGWYGVGLVVTKEFRGQGLAHALSNYRIQWLKTEAKAEELYTFASAENPVSLKMHKEFGFEEVMTGPGFLNTGFDCGKGVLFRIKIQCGKQK